MSLVPSTNQIATGDTVLVVCRISSGGFSAERTVRLGMKAAGDPDFIGTAPVEYCFATAGIPLGKRQPEGDGGFGLVRCVVRGFANGGLHVEMPQGGRIIINESAVRFVERTVKTWEPIRAKAVGR